MSMGPRNLGFIGPYWALAPPLHIFEFQDMSQGRVGGVRGTSPTSNDMTSDAEISYDTIKDVSSTDKSKPKKVNKKLNNNKKDDDIMLDMIHDIKSHFEKQLAEAKADFINQTTVMKAEFKGQVEALHQVIQDQNNTIIKLQIDAEELKKSCSFLTDETTSLKGYIKTNELSIDGVKKKHDQLIDKTCDLEDRSRRNNVVFYNIPESDDAQSEDCENIIVNVLKRQGFFRPDYAIEIDRAHRLGKREEDKTRPIIVRFTFYKDKEEVLKKGILFKGCNISASQDFSKITLGIHKQLRIHGKNAQDTLNNDKNQSMSIIKFKVTYRRVLLTYSSNKTLPAAPKFTKSFSLQYIEGNKNWFIPSARSTYSNVGR